MRFGVHWLCEDFVKIRGSQFHHPGKLAVIARSVSWHWAMKKFDNRRSLRGIFELPGRLRPAVLSHSFVAIQIHFRPSAFVYLLHGLLQIAVRSKGEC